MGTLPRAFDYRTQGIEFPKHAVGLKFHGSNLIAKGKRIGSIAVVGEELTADTTYIPGTEGWTRVIRNWETIAVNLQDKLSGYEVINNFLETLKLHGDYDVREIRACHAWGHCTYSRQNRTEVEDHDMRVGKFVETMENVCYGRSFFVNEKGEMGLAPPAAKATDELVYFPGTEYAFVLRKVGKEYKFVGDCWLTGFNLNATMKDETKMLEEFVIR